MSGNETWISVAPPRTFAFKVKAAEPTYFKRHHFYCKGSLCSILHSFTIASWVVDKTWSVCKPGGDFRANSAPNQPSILLQPASPSNSNLQQPFANLGKHIFPSWTAVTRGSLVLAMDSTATAHNKQKIPQFKTRRKYLVGCIRKSILPNQICSTAHCGNP